MYSSNVFFNKDFVKLFLYTIILSILIYGFAFTNYTLTIDNELPIYSDFGMDTGRWGQNLIRYHLFKGHLQYFTLLLSLLMFSLSAVKLAFIFNFKIVYKYLFVTLFMSFPQISYQVVFSVMADVASLGFLLSVLSYEFFIKNIEEKSIYKKTMLIFFLSLILMFTISIYQALLLVPITIYIIHLFQKSFTLNFNLKNEIIKFIYFVLILFFSIILYIISVKLFCPSIEGGYLSTFVSGNSDNQLISFLKIFFNNIIGNAYYGERLFVIVTILEIVLIIKIIIKKDLLLFKLLLLLFLFLSPFFISFFITNGYHPPRLYLTSNLLFAFIIIFYFSEISVINYNRIIVIISVLLVINIYFVTNLFHSANKIFKHDKRIAEKIDNIIQYKYPEFYSSSKIVYFYGHLPYDYHNVYRLKNSEIFGGSYFIWDNGNNYRIINFFREAEIANYKMVDKIEDYNKVKDSIAKMQVWPSQNCIKKFDNIIVVKLGNEKGVPLPFE